MDFTYKSYENLLQLLNARKYKIIDYFNENNLDKSVILRHDIDNSLDKALEMAKIEYNNNVKSTYFVLLSTDFYNVFSKRSNNIISEILKLGHHIGLHFDEKRYDITDFETLEKYVKYESDILSSIINKPIKVISMHRPSEWILNNDVKFNNLINTYSHKYFREFKYLSDSRMFWRENVEEIILNERFDKLHILTHPFWYSTTKENAKEKILNYIEAAKKERYLSLKDNIRDLNDLIEER